MSPPFGRTTKPDRAKPYCDPFSGRQSGWSGKRTDWKSRGAIPSERESHSRACSHTSEWSPCEDESLGLETVEIFCLLSTINDPIGEIHFRCEVVTGPEVRVVEGKKIEKIGARVVELILNEVIFEAEGARPFSKIDGQAAAERSDVGTIRLEEIAPSLGTKFFGGAALQSLGGLTILENDARAEAAALIEVWGMLDDDGGPIQAEAVAADVVSAQEIHPTHGTIEIVFAVAIEKDVEGRAVQEIFRAGLRGLLS